MNKPKTDTPSKKPRRERVKAPDMERFYGRWAKMHPFIATRKMAKLTKHDRGNWNGQ